MTAREAIGGALWMIGVILKPVALIVFWTLAIPLLLFSGGVVWLGDCVDDYKAARRRA